ncbi:MAG TPA: protein TolB [Anaeromyxobacter sp.]
MTRILLAAALAVAAPAIAQERSYVDVGSPNFQPLPIAVADFQGEGEARAAHEAAEVVRGDLAMSGLFDVLDPKGFLADPGEGFAASSIRFARWSDVGAEGLVRARVRRDGADVVGDLHVYEVRAGRESLAKTVRTPAASPRALGHRLADEIVRLYTREPGVFSTQLAAIRKARGLFELVLFDADGRNPRVLLSERSILLTPSWRPDGKEILLTSYRAGRPELWSLRLQDRAFRRVGQVTNAMGGVYSPDGTHIAFTATEGGNSDVWLMAADGSNARRLTKEPALDLSPTWSPDGKKIAFVSDRAGTPQVYVMNADGSGVRRLTFQGNYNQTPQWSPRGDLVAFTARDERKVFDVFVVSPESGKIERITQDQGRTNEEPTWAPNGRLVAFRSDRKGVAQLVVSDPKGDRQTPVAGGVGDLSAPAWGPFAE